MISRKSVITSRYDDEGYPISVASISDKGDIEIELEEDADYEKMAEKFKCSIELIRFFEDFALQITDNFRILNRDVKDLADIVLD